MVLRLGWTRDSGPKPSDPLTLTLSPGAGERGMKLVRRDDPDACPAVRRAHGCSIPQDRPGLEKVPDRNEQRKVPADRVDCSRRATVGTDGLQCQPSARASSGSVPQEKGRQRPGRRGCPNPRQRSAPGRSPEPDRSGYQKGGRVGGHRADEQIQEECEYPHAAHKAILDYCGPFAVAFNCRLAAFSISVLPLLRADG
jgi:hypothetical protein